MELLQIFILQIPEIKEIPQGEINLLHYMIYVLIGVVVVLAGVVAYMYKHTEQLAKEGHQIAKEAIQHIERSNVLTEQVVEVSEDSKDVTKELLILMRGKNWKSSE